MNQFVLKVIIPDESVKGQFTAYLFDEKDHYLIPISTSDWACRSILLAKNNMRLARPHVHDSMVRIIRCFGAKADSVLIYRVVDGVFYAYVRLSKGPYVFDIDVKVTDAICMALRFNVPIYVRGRVVRRAGIKVTKELILRSLE